MNQFGTINGGPDGLGAGPRFSPAEGSEQRIRQLEQYIKTLKVTAGVNPLTRAQRESLQQLQGNQIMSAFGLWTEEIKAKLLPLEPRLQAVLANVEQHVGNPVMQSIKAGLTNVERQMTRAQTGNGSNFNVVTFLASVDGLNIKLRSVENLLTAGGPHVDAIRDTQVFVAQLLDTMVMQNMVLPPAQNPMNTELMPGSRMQRQNQATTIMQAGGALIGGVALLFGLVQLFRGKGGTSAAVLGGIATYAAFNANNNRTHDGQPIMLQPEDRWQNEIAPLGRPGGEYLSLAATYRFSQDGPQWATMVETIKTNGRARTLIGKGLALTPEEKTELLDALAPQGNPIRPRVERMMAAKTISDTQRDTDLQVYTTIVQSITSRPGRAFLDSYVRSGANPSLMAGLPTSQMA